MIKYAVFDWDGTLADTYRVIVGGYRAVFLFFGMPIPPAANIKEITAKAQNKNIFSLFFKESQIPQARKVYYDYIQKNHLTKLKAISGAKDVLDFCLANNITPLLITNKNPAYLKEEIKVLGFEKYFKKIVAAGDCLEDKPHEIACKALFDGKIPPSGEVIVIGDGKADVEVARVYKAPSVIYQNKAKGDYNITNLLEVIRIIERKNNEATK